MGTQERGHAAVVTCPGKRRGGGSHSQWVGSWERSEVANSHSQWVGTGIEEWERGARCGC